MAKSCISSEFFFEADKQYPKVLRDVEETTKMYFHINIKWK